jgi:hypothetical protein
MAGWADVAALAGGLAAVEEGTSYGNRAWIPRADLEEAIVEAWLARAPRRLAAAYLDARTG